MATVAILTEGSLPHEPCYTADLNVEKSSSGPSPPDVAKSDGSVHPPSLGASNGSCYKEVTMSIDSKIKEVLLKDITLLKVNSLQVEVYEKNIHKWLTFSLAAILLG